MPDYLLGEGIDLTNNRAEQALGFAVLRHRLMPGSFDEKEHLQSIYFSPLRASNSLGASFVT